MGANMPKQYLPLRGQPIATYSLRLFAALPSVGEIVVVCDPSYRDVFTSAQLPRAVPLSFALPGKERQDSVFNGLQAIRPAAQLVAIHDSARPLVTRQGVCRMYTSAHLHLTKPPLCFLVPPEIEAVFRDAAAHGAAVLGVQTKATIKQARADRFVERTLDRSTLWEMHTPQVIQPDILRRGFALVAEKGLAVTDDVSIVEALGLPVLITQGQYTNLKVTTPEDMFIAERLLDERQQHTTK
jgi:2-C-methyl-D-erythritol 4-phosphate cytidylyltransferase